MSSPNTSGKIEAFSRPEPAIRARVSAHADWPAHCPNRRSRWRPRPRQRAVGINGWRALTATELAYFCEGHAADCQLASRQARRVGLLALEKQGRHRYYRLASPLVGRMLGIMAVAEAGPARYRPHWKGCEALRTARTCYDHLAGRLAVALADALVARGYVVLAEDGGEVTVTGIDFLTGLGVDLGTAVRHRRIFCKPCLDWSEQRPHLAGAVGATLAARAFELGWVERIKNSRAVAIAEAGHRGFFETFGVAIDAGESLKRDHAV